MTRRPGPLVRGFVLHGRPWRDTSMLLEAFTLDAGRIGLVARGVRRRGNRQRPLLVPFQPLLLAWTGRGELRTLTTVDTEQWYAQPTGRALLAAYYCNELLLRLLARDQVEPDAFAAYERVIAGLGAESIPETGLRRFELALLDALGYAPLLDVEADTGVRVSAHVEYDFRPGSGPVVAQGPAEPDTVRVTGAHLLALAAGKLDDEGALRSARRILRSSLAPHLGAAPLKTRQMFRAMYGPQGDPG